MEIDETEASPPFAHEGVPACMAEVRTGRAVASSSRHDMGCLDVWRPCATPRASRHDVGCLEVSDLVSGGPARLLRASRHDMGCLEVSGGPARLLRASRLYVIRLESVFREYEKVGAFGSVTLPPGPAVKETQKFKQLC